MNIVDFKEEIKNLVEEIGYVKDTQIVDETVNTIKLRLIVNKFCFIQIYINIKKKLKNYVVLLSGQRVFGIDCDGGRWHLHPWDDPNGHKYTKKVSLRDFLFQVYKELQKKQLL